MGKKCEILKINGMKCEGCSQRLEKALKNIEGIDDASVDLDTREAKVVFDSEKITLKDIHEAVTDVGFEVEE